MNTRLLARTGPLKRTKRLTGESAKLKRARREYGVARLVYLAEHPVCMARAIDACELRASQVHHKRGRVGADLLDVEYWLAVCGPCHTHITEHPAEAYEAGWSERRVSRG